MPGVGGKNFKNTQFVRTGVALLLILPFPLSAAPPKASETSLHCQKYLRGIFEAPVLEAQSMGLDPGDARNILEKQETRDEYMLLVKLRHRLKAAPHAFFSDLATGLSSGRFSSRRPGDSILDLAEARLGLLNEVAKKNGVRLSPEMANQLLEPLLDFSTVSISALSDDAMLRGLNKYLDTMTTDEVSAIIKVNRGRSRFILRRYVSVKETTSNIKKMLRSGPYREQKLKVDLEVVRDIHGIYGVQIERVRSSGDSEALKILLRSIVGSSYEAFVQSGVLVDVPGGKDFFFRLLQFAYSPPEPKVVWPRDVRSVFERHLRHGLGVLNHEVQSFLAQQRNANASLSPESTNGSSPEKLNIPLLSQEARPRTVKIRVRTKPRSREQAPTPVPTNASVPPPTRSEERRRLYQLLSPTPSHYATFVKELEEIMSGKGAVLGEKLDEQIAMSLYRISLGRNSNELGPSIRRTRKEGIWEIKPSAARTVRVLVGKDNGSVWLLRIDENVKSGNKQEKILQDAEKEFAALKKQNLR